MDIFLVLPPTRPTWRFPETPKAPGVKFFRVVLARGAWSGVPGVGARCGAPASWGWRLLWHGLFSTATPGSQIFRPGTVARFSVSYPEKRKVGEFVESEGLCGYLTGSGPILSKAREPRAAYKCLSSLFYTLDTQHCVVLAAGLHESRFLRTVVQQQVDDRTESTLRVRWLPRSPALVLTDQIIWEFFVQGGGSQLET